ncbi:MAG: bifunctional pyr operon transcriptional regulator/uracil phosphoribosyltransferase PyrR [Phaeodactylibacter sp.]|nr:bifunctional pyr operon transcriptional regulator/uracil phosphoribosyltransferase PyrR [Phaeodactylibacter sp.]MCB9304092.1 bifunctional pyr operon transcriptional regulator/uracil phosphoribosyltransferase PyrR [Lewinellaceae bacterium]
MSKGRLIIGQERFALTIDRLCHQLIEQHGAFENTCLIGIQPRGVRLSNRLYQRLTEILSTEKIPYGKLDITFYRDDFRTRDKPLKASPTEIDFIVEDKRVVLVDDVLYTGRTVQAALTALNHYGRPLQVELLALVDRRFNRHLPIQSDYIGVTVDALDHAYVRVEWADTDGEDRVMLFADKKEAEK